MLEKSIGNLPGLFKSRRKRINNSYKSIDFLFGRRRIADTVVNLATAEFSFGAGLGVGVHEPVSSALFAKKILHR